MNKKLSDLGNSISAAHEAVDAVVDYVRGHEGHPRDWRVGLAEVPPQTLYDINSSSDDPFTRELPDQKTARYALRELVDRGFPAVDGADDEENPQKGRWLYAYRGA